MYGNKKTGFKETDDIGKFMKGKSLNTSVVGGGS